MNPYSINSSPSSDPQFICTTPEYSQTSLRFTSYIHSKAIVANVAHLEEVDRLKIEKYLLPKGTLFYKSSSWKLIAFEIYTKFSITLLPSALSQYYFQDLEPKLRNFTPSNSPLEKIRAIETETSTKFDKPSTPPRESKHTKHPVHVASTSLEYLVFSKVKQASCVTSLHLLNRDERIRIEEFLLDKNYSREDLWKWKFVASEVYSRFSVTLSPIYLAEYYQNFLQPRLRKFVDLQDIQDKSLIDRINGYLIYTIPLIKTEISWIGLSQKIHSQYKILVNPISLRDHYRSQISRLHTDLKNRQNTIENNQKQGYFTQNIDDQCIEIQKKISEYLKARVLVGGGTILWNTIAREIAAFFKVQINPLNISEYFKELMAHENLKKPKTCVSECYNIHNIIDLSLADSCFLNSSEEIQGRMSYLLATRAASYFENPCTESYINVQKAFYEKFLIIIPAPTMYCRYIYSSHLVDFLEKNSSYVITLIREKSFAWKEILLALFNGAYASVYLNPGFIETWYMDWFRKQQLSR